ncbi:toll/interleukin-1 receptor domain-containing protein [Candidatus Pacearchaeota archaeon]|nr:toll/interleukin-1 receptor domain-containing protein [Candidatus Pacearchaeota archaeon]
MSYSTEKIVDFAISYAGEDLEEAKILATALREFSFSVFLADEQRRRLVSEDGEEFFERLFSESKQVVAFISKHYREKEWTRFEWDIIRKRNRSNRYIPIRLDDTLILGLPSNIIYLTWSPQETTEVVKTCIERLLLYERSTGIHRPSIYEEILDEIQNKSRGSLAKAYQLIADNRERSPLEDAEFPKGNWTLSYLIVRSKWLNYSKVRRRDLKVRLSADIGQEELIYNLKYCCIREFNDYKPDAVSVSAYSPEADLDNASDLAIVEFAPFGDWGRAEEGFAFNIPVQEFDFSLRIMRR